MAAVLGLDFDEVDKICKELSTEDQLIEPANINSCLSHKFTTFTNNLHGIFK
jgi:malonyl CoA-acyl carrier protein transacylase